MKKYIGTKIVEASKSTRGEFWGSVDYPEEARMGEEHENGYMVMYPDGYVSWSPTKAFEQAYREMTSMTFGGALEMLRRGKKVARKGWNGKGIFIELYNPTCDLDLVAEAVHNGWWNEKKRQGVTDHPDMIPYEELSETTKEYDRVTVKATIEATKYMTHPYIFIDTTGLQTENPHAPKNRVPWLASQTDMLAEDWEVVE